RPFDKAMVMESVMSLSGFPLVWLGRQAADARAQQL
ncbi:MAG: hypothetical protein AWU57_4886, partial [Marinobacter sp. T13-3]